MKKMPNKKQELDNVIEEAFNELMALPKAELQELINSPENDDIAKLILASNMFDAGELENSTYACSYEEYEPTEVFNDFSAIAIGKDYFKISHRAFTELTKFTINATPDLIGLDLTNKFVNLQSFLKYQAPRTSLKTTIIELHNDRLGLSNKILYSGCLNDQDNYQWIV